MVVASLNVIAKSLPHLGRVLDAIRDRGAYLVSNDLDPRTPLTSAQLSTIHATITVHRSLSNQRALDGARHTVAPNGRPPVLDDAGKRRLRQMLREGASQADICAELGISRTSAHRYRKQLEDAAELAVV